jgi:hypothetical protein
MKPRVQYRVLWASLGSTESRVFYTMSAARAHALRVHGQIRVEPRPIR